MASARLVLDAQVGTRARVRVWRADGPVDVDPRPAAHGGVELSWIVDGRVSYADKAALELATLPSSNATGTAESDEALRNAIAVRAWKAFRVWRTREGDLDELQGFGLERGGRERLATLFYLRGYCAGGS